MVGIAHIDTAADFKALLSANKYVIADFYADWCGPCKAIAPLYEKLAAEHGVDDQFAFAKINVDKVPEVSKEYGVRAMPTFMFFANGSPAAVDVPTVGRAAVRGANGVEHILGADPRALTAVAGKLGELAKRKATASAAGTTSS